MGNRHHSRRSRVASLSHGPLLLEPLEPRILLSASPLDDLILRPWSGGAPANETVPPTAISLDAGTAGQVMGRVWYDMNGNGVRDHGEPGVHLSVFSDLNGDGELDDAGEPSARSGDDGMYTLTLEAGTHDVRLELIQSWMLADPVTQVRQITVAPGEAVTGIDFPLRLPSSAIAGTVYEDYFGVYGDTPPAYGANFLADWLVFLDSNRDGVPDPGEVSTTTNAQGHYIFTDLAPGFHRVAFDLPEYHEATDGGGLAYRDVYVSNSRTTVQNFGLRVRPDVLGGVVWEDRNGDGIRQEDEPPVVDTVVYIDRDNDGVHDNTGFAWEREPYVETDADGRFLFTNLAEGDYVLRVKVHYAQSWWVYHSEIDDRRAGELDRKIGLRTPSSWIVGEVLVDYDGDGRKDTQDHGAEGITVYVDLNDNDALDDDEPAVLTDASGRYKINGYVHGHPAVRILMPEHWRPSVAGGDEHLVWVAAGRTESAPRFYLHPIPAWLAGRLFDDVNRDGVFDAEEPGLSGWTVYLDLNTNGQWNEDEPRAISNEDGTYELLTHVEGQTTLRVALPPYWIASTPDGATTADVSLALAMQINDLDFALHSTVGRVTGMVFEDVNADGVRDESEGGLEGWRVFADANGDGVFQWGEPVGWADADGRYTVERVAPGSYVLISDGLDGWMRTVAAMPFTIVDGDHLNGPTFGYVALPSEIRGVHWHDRNANGERDAGEPGLAGWTMFLDLDGDRVLDPGERSTLTGLDGSYVFDNLSRGLHNVVAVVPDGWEQTAPFAPPAEIEQLGLIPVDPWAWGGSTLSFSGDGRFLAFVAHDPAAPQVHQWEADVFLYDRQTGDLKRLSAIPNGGWANAASYSVSISADGRYVAFVSQASNLLPGPFEDLVGKVFLYDRLQDSLMMVSGYDKAGQMPLESWIATISADGSTVVYTGQSDEGSWAGQIHVYDVASQTGRHVGFAPDGQWLNGDVWVMSLSGDGRYLVASATVTNLLDPQGNDADGGFYRLDLWTGARQRLGPLGYGAASSLDGAWAAVALHEPLNPSDGDGWHWFYLLDGQGGTQLLTPDPVDWANLGQLSGDGRWTIFTQGVFHGSDVNDAVMLYDRLSDTTSQVATLNGVPSWLQYASAGISADGRSLAYTVIDSTHSGAPERGLYIGPVPGVPPLGVRQVMLAAGEVTDGVDFGAAEPAAEIHGRVFVDANANGMWDTGEAPASGWMVFADLDGDGVRDEDEPSAQTDGDGAYRLAEVPSAFGAVRVQAVAPTPHAPTTVPAGEGSPQPWQVVLVEPDVIREAADLGFRVVLPTITGQLWFDYSRDGMWDDHEPALAGRVVFLDTNFNGRPDADERVTVSDAQGRYRFEDMTEGSYRVATWLHDGWRWTNAPISDLGHATATSSGLWDAWDSSYVQDISADGRYVVFSSDAHNLVQESKLDDRDVFVFDAVTGELRRISQKSDGSDGSGGNHYGYAISDRPRISADGRYVVFQSNADFDLPEPAEGWMGFDGLFVADLATGDLWQPAYEIGDWGYHVLNVAAEISADGQYLAFTVVGHRVDGGQGFEDVLVYDTLSGEVEALTPPPIEPGGQARARRPQISPDGRYVAMLGTVGSGRWWDLFVYDRQTAQWTRTDLGNSDRLVQADVLHYDMSTDGQFVVFATDAGGLAPDDSAGTMDVFLVDLHRNRRTRLNVDASGQPVGPAGLPEISGDGRLVSYIGPNLHDGPGQPAEHIYVYDTQTGARRPVDFDGDGTALPMTWWQVMADDGLHFAGESMPFDGTGSGIIHIYTAPTQIGPGLASQVVHVPAHVDAVGPDFGFGRVPQPGHPRGDFNGDGVADTADINAMILAMTDTHAFAEAFGHVDMAAADPNQDGTIDAADIPVMVGLLTASTQPFNGGTAAASRQAVWSSPDPWILPPFVVPSPAPGGGSGGVIVVGGGSISTEDINPLSPMLAGGFTSSIGGMSALGQMSGVLSISATGAVALTTGTSLTSLVDVNAMSINLLTPDLLTANMPAADVLDLLALDVAGAAWS